MNYVWLGTQVSALVIAALLIRNGAIQLDACTGIGINLNVFAFLYFFRLCILDWRKKQTPLTEDQ